MAENKGSNYGEVNVPSQADAERRVEESIAHRRLLDEERDMKRRAVEWLESLDAKRKEELCSRHVAGEPNHYVKRHWELHPEALALELWNRHGRGDSTTMFH